MYRVSNFFQNDDVDVISQLGAFSVIQWKRDLSVDRYSAQQAWFSAQMNVRRRQVVCNLAHSSVTVQAGAMQWTVGPVEASTGVRGVGDFFGKTLRGAVTKESAIKPVYQGQGMLVLEPTYKHILLQSVDEWGGGIVLDDGLFLACESQLQHQTVMRANFSSAVAGGEGLFNLSLVGSGVVALESPCPKQELIFIELDNDVLKIDGNMALAWSPSLEFSVERSGKSLLGSAASGEGLVNVYRGSGRVLMAPTVYTSALAPANTND